MNHDFSLEIHVWCDWLMTRYLLSIPVPYPGYRSGLFQSIISSDRFDHTIHLPYLPDQDVSCPVCGNFSECDDVLDADESDDTWGRAGFFYLQIDHSLTYWWKNILGFTVDRWALRCAIHSHWSPHNKWLIIQEPLIWWHVGGIERTLMII